MISMQGVTKQFGAKIAVDDLSLEIQPGEFFAILGPNGAGKTTTIKMIAGLLRPTKGTIHVAGPGCTKYIKPIRIIACIVYENPCSAGIFSHV